MTGLSEPGLPELPPLRGDTAYQLDVGRVIRQTFSVTLSNLPSFLLVGLIVYSPALLVLLIAAASGEAAPWLFLVATVLQILLGFVLTGALTYAVVRELRGQRCTIGEIAVAGSRSLVPVLGVSLLVGIVATIGFVMCIVPGVVISCMNWVAVPVAVIERPGIRTSLDRSHDLTRGTRWAVFAVLLVMQVLILGASSIATIGLVLAGARLGGSLAPGAVQALTAVTQTFLLLPFQCLYAASAAVGYHDLRVNREGAATEDLVRVFE